METLGPLLVGAHASSAIVAGHHAGLWDVLHGHPNKKWGIGELAEAANCKERWVKEWVGVLASAKVVSLTEDLIVSCDPDVAAHLVSSADPLYFFTSLEFAFDKETKIGACFKKDGPLGVGYSDYPNFQGWMAGWTDCRNTTTNFPTGYFNMIGDGLHEALSKGIRVLEPGCGQGRHVMKVAKAYPQSHFTSFDIDEDTVNANRDNLKKAGLTNVDFLVNDFCKMPEEWNNSFDYIMIFDCMHDLPFPSQAMMSLKRVLKDNGMVSMLDIDTSSDMAKQTKNPISAVLYNISLHHCMSVSLSNGGVGVGTCWGVELATQMLHDAGWKESEIRVITGEITNHAIYVMTKGSGLL